MITLFTGLPGSGKSYKMVSELWKNKNKYFIIHNIVGFQTEVLKDYGFNWVEYCEKNQIEIETFFSKDYQIELAAKIREKYKRNMLIIIDEAHEWFDRNVKALKMWLSYHRHINQQIYLVAHATKNIPQTYRTFVEVEYRAKSGAFIFLPGYFFYNRIIGGQRAGFIFERKLKKIFALYKSHDLQVTDKEVSKKNYLIPAIVGLVIILFIAFLKAPQFIMGGDLPEQKELTSEIQMAKRPAAPAIQQKMEIPFDEKYAFVGQIAGRVILENRQTGVQNELHRIPGSFKILAIHRADYCILYNEKSQVHVVRNFNRYNAPAVDSKPARYNLGGVEGRQQRPETAPPISEGENFS